MSEALAKAQLALFLGNLQRRGGVRVLDENIRTLAQQNLGGIGFLARIKPGVDPDDLHLEIRIDRLRAQHEGIDAGHNFRDREGHDVARRSGL